MTAAAVRPARVPRRPATPPGLLALLFVLALAHGTLYAVITPPWQAPDEIAHFEYAWLFAKLRVPLWNESASPELERAIIQSLYDYHAWTYVGVPTPAEPPARLAEAPFFRLSRTLTRFSLTYVLYAAAALPFESAGLITQLYAMRAVSVVLGALVVLLTYRLARLVEPQSPALAWGSALFVLLLPQHAFINGVVNDGTLAEALATLAVYGVVRQWRPGVSWRWLALTAVSAGAALLSKTTAVFLLPLLALAALAAARRWFSAPGRTTAQRRQAALALLAGGAALLVGGWFFLPWLNRVSSTLVSVTATLQATLGNAGAWGAYLQRLLTGDALGQAIAQTFESFWGYFGWMVVRLPGPWLLVAAGLTLLALAGWGLRLAADRRDPARPGVKLYVPVALAGGLALLVLLAWFIGTPLGVEFSQGRYVFGAIAPLAVLLVSGWLGLGPRHRQGPLLLGLLAVWVVFDAVALFGALLPYFYRVV